MADEPNAPGHPGEAGPVKAADALRLTRLLRYSHIFSAAVREILEARYLADVSSDPLTIHQFHVLKLISLNGYHRVGEIADFLGVSSPAATKNIDKLERLGLVSRRPSPEDRRAMLLSASPRGRQMVRDYEEHKINRLDPVLAHFRPEEIDQLARLLQRLSVLLFERERTDREFCLRCAAYVEEDCPVGHVLEDCPYEKIRSRNRTELEPILEGPSTS